ncbi:MAG: MT-A70 family methyltransferase [Aquiluna sp.]|jgi:N6-adenosine-specific RNA methylase IME4
MNYQIIYADPPWTYRDKAHSGQRGVEYKYPTMTLADIKALPIASIAAPDCLLAMWWVNPQAAEALEVVEAWGFKLKLMHGFVWHKVTSTGKDFFGMGNYTRGNAECCLFGVRGKPKRVSASVRQVIHAPNRQHSQKPDEARDRLVELMGNVPRVELFARQSFPGWDCWGNQVESTIAL